MYAHAIEYNSAVDTSYGLHEYHQFKIQINPQLTLIESGRSGFMKADIYLIWGDTFKKNNAKL